MAALGHIEEFDPAFPEKWVAYQARLNFFLEANGITEPERKRAVFFSVCSAATFDLARSLLSPAAPDTKTLTQILAVLKDHFAPQPSEIVCRNAFYKRNQGPGESVSVFMAELRRLAQNCNFANLEEMLRDRLVCGLRNDKVQNRLFAMKKLTFKIALEEALAAEAADLSTREVRGAESASDAAPNSTDVNAVRRSQDEYSRRSSEAMKAQTGRKMNPCYGCGGAHNRESCRFRDAQCRFCKKTGHIERVCLMKQRRDASATTTSSTNAVDASQEDKPLATCSSKAKSVQWRWTQDQSSLSFLSIHIGSFVEGTKSLHSKKVCPTFKATR